MFSVPLFQYEIDQWETKKEQLKKIYEEYSTTLQRQGYFEANTDYHDQMKNGFKYKEQIEEILSDEINLFKNESELNHYKIYDSWFELASENQFHAVHAHGPIGYSSVCFIDFDSSVHQGTIFVSPFNNFITGSGLRYISNVSEGTIIFFPSIINHYTMPHSSSKERLILSFNMRNMR
jgi:hypothetical protein